MRIGFPMIRREVDWRIHLISDHVLTARCDFTPGDGTKSENVCMARGLAANYPNELT